MTDLRILQGNARVIFPGVSACIDCTLDLYPPQVNFPLCTIAHTPRLPEHCVEYSKILLWPKEKPFGEDTNIDGDDPQHISWIYEKARERAEQFGIQGVTFRLTQGVVKRIIPAVASTNAVIAAACATEVFKVATSCCNPLNNYMVFNDSGNCSNPSNILQLIVVLLRRCLHVCVRAGEEPGLSSLQPEAAEDQVP